MGWKWRVVCAFSCFLGFLCGWVVKVSGVGEMGTGVGVGVGVGVCLVDLGTGREEEEEEEEKEGMVGWWRFQHTLLCLLPRPPHTHSPSYHSSSAPSFPSFSSLDLQLASYNTQPLPLPLIFLSTSHLIP